MGRVELWGALGVVERGDPPSKKKKKVAAATVLWRDPRGLQKTEERKAGAQ